MYNHAMQSTLTAVSVAAAYPCDCPVQAMFRRRKPCLSDEIAEEHGGLQQPELLDVEPHVPLCAFQGRLMVHLFGVSASAASQVWAAYRQRSLHGSKVEHSYRRTE